MLVEDYRRRLAAREVKIAEIAKSEMLGQNPEAYEQFVAGGGKPRRAAAEVALQMNPRPRMGDRVSYYITAKAKRPEVGLAAGAGRAELRSGAGRRTIRLTTPRNSTTGSSATAVFGSVGRAVAGRAVLTRRHIRSCFGLLTGPGGKWLPESGASASSNVRCADKRIN